MAWSTGSCGARRRRAAGGEAYYARHPYGMSLIWGDGVPQAFDELVDHLGNDEHSPRTEWLQVDPRWAALPWSERLAAPGARRPLSSTGTRLNFEFDYELFRSGREGIPTPAGWSIVRADATDFGLEGSVVPSKFWRNAGQFVQQGGGWRAERHGITGALVFTSFRRGSDLELGIETVPDLRGRGLAAAVAARMIDDIVARGITPVWACREANHASAALAAKLGFRVARRLPFYELPAMRRPHHRAPSTPTSAIGSITTARATAGFPASGTS